MLIKGPVAIIVESGQVAGAHLTDGVFNLPYKLPQALEFNEPHCIKVMTAIGVNAPYYVLSDFVQQSIFNNSMAGYMGVIGGCDHANFWVNLSCNHIAAAGFLRFKPVHQTKPIVHRQPKRSVPKSDDLLASLSKNYSLGELVPMPSRSTRTGNKTGDGKTGDETGVDKPKTPAEDMEVYHVTSRGLINANSPEAQSALIDDEKSINIAGADLSVIFNIAPLSWVDKYGRA